ncbi:ABC transporter permease [Ruicaihuangia caeni]|uniref:ABC transporter permease n=1 Tax=Ruicaihuangia caeni TaxID=3042517 RepID=UPI00338E72BA
MALRESLAYAETPTRAVATNAAKAKQRQPRRVSRQIARSAAVVVGILVGAVALWEGYKAMGQLTGDVIPFTSIPLPVSSSDYAMPHTWVIFDALMQPANAGATQSLLLYYLDQTSVTLREAGYGLVIGALIGVVLAVALREVQFLTRGVLPWLVISQTIPLVALAPIIVVWAGSAGMPSWIAVTVIAAYLAFFPVTVNMLTGLNAIDPIHDEFMQSINAPRWFTLLFVRFPTALPNLFTGLRLAATASVIGAIVGELSAGTGLGIGRAILTAAYYYSNAPENLFAAVLIASLAGVVFVQVITIVEAIALRKRTN